MSGEARTAVIERYNLSRKMIRNLDTLRRQGEVELPGPQGAALRDLRLVYQVTVKGTSEYAIPPRWRLTDLDHGVAIALMTS